MDRVETVIVGAGLSGLACASTLEKHKKEYLIVEKSNRVGGRVGSIYENDYIFDVGGVKEDWTYLESLAGVGHKTASVVMSQWFNVPAFPVDTHIHRLAARWGLSNGKNVEKTELDLKKLWPEKVWNRRHLQIIFFGREHCPARGHNLNECLICSWAASKNRILMEMVNKK